MNIARLSQFLREKEHEVILVALCLVAVAFSLLNPLWYGEAPGFDASLFALIGKMWAGGEVLYQDMIDIKGPGIFFINMIGYRLGGFAGIAFIETILLVFGVISVDLALRVFKFTPLSRFCSITTVISLLGLRYYYGNMTEDYALYLAMISSYPYALLFYRRRFNWSLSIIPSLVLAFTLSIRVNNAAYMLAWDTMLFLFYCANGRLWDGCKLTISALLGVLLVFGGFCSYFYILGGYELLYQAFYYSIGIFFADGAYGAPGLNLLVGTVGFFRTGCFIVLIGFVWLLFSKDNNLINSPNAKYNDRFWFLLYIITGILMTIVANSVSGHVYDHYDQLFMAFMFIPLAFLMHRYLHVKQDIHISFLTILFLLIYLVAERVLFGPWEHRQQNLEVVFVHILADTAVAIVLCTILFAVRRILGFYRHNHTFFLCLSVGIALMLGVYAVYLGPHSGRPWDDTTNFKVELVKANTEVTERIWVEGDMPQYYIWTDRLPVSPYLFFSNVNDGRNLKTKVLGGIEFFKPKFIIIRARLVKEFRDQNGDPKTYSAAERDFFKYVFTNYRELVPGLFALKSEVQKMDLSLLKQYLNEQTTKEVAEKASLEPDEETSTKESSESSATASNTKESAVAPNKASADQLKQEVEVLPTRSEAINNVATDVGASESNQTSSSLSLEEVPGGEIKLLDGTVVPMQDADAAKEETSKATTVDASESQAQTEAKASRANDENLDASKQTPTSAEDGSKLEAQTEAEEIKLN